MNQFRFTIAELAEMVGGRVEGDPDVLVTGIAVVEDAQRGDLVIADRSPYFEKALTSPASCILTGQNCGSAADGKPLLRSDSPQEAFMQMLKIFGPAEYKPAPGVAIGAVVEDDAVLGEGVSVGANAYIGHGAKVGAGTIIYPSVYLGDNTTIGENCRIYPNVSIYSTCTLGDRVILHAGCVVGGDGFGFKSCGASGLLKYPHIGSVEIGDDVEVGANSTIDRAKTGKTIVGKGTKIDNLVHIAHNAKIGENCIIVAQVGVAGSAQVGNGVTLAAQSGVRDHVSVGDSTIVAARSGVTANIPGSVVVSGFPARDHKTEMRVEAARLRLPDMLKRLRALEKEIAILSGKELVAQEDDA